MFCSVRVICLFGPPGPSSWGGCQTPGWLQSSVCPPPPMPVYFEAGPARARTKFLSAPFLWLGQLPLSPSVPSARAFTHDSAAQATALSGLRVVVHADQAAVWARGVAQQCSAGTPPVDIRGSIEAFTGVLNNVGATVAPHARYLVDKVFAARHLLRQDALQSERLWR